MRRLHLTLAACAVLALPAGARAEAAAAPATAAGAAQIDPVRERALYLEVIDGLRRDGRAHAALAHLDAFELKYPRDPKAQIMRADCLSDIADYAGAEALYRKLATGPAAAEAEAGLGHVYARRGDWTAAAAAFGEAVRRRPTDAAYLGDLGFALMQAGRTGEALFRLRQAAELAPEDARIRNNLLAALERSGAREETAERLGAIAAPAERDAVAALLVAHRAGVPSPQPRGETP
jgi:Flp pilus assembly protein TadD